MPAEGAQGVCGKRVSYGGRNQAAQGSHAAAPLGHCEGHIHVLRLYGHGLRGYSDADE